MTEVQNLVKQNRIKEAIAALPQDNQTLLLSSRFSSLQREANLGLISKAEESLRHNQIVAAILSIAGNSNDSQPSSYQSPITYHPATPKQLTPSKIRAILERKNIGEDETSELIAACLQVLDFFKSNLSDDEYLDLCADAEMAFRKFSARPKDEDRKFSLVEQVQKMLPDYENFAEVSNTESIIETLYNKANEAKTIAAFKPYFEAVLRKFPKYEHLKSSFEVEEIEFQDRAISATPLSKRMLEKTFCESWLYRIGKP